MTRIVNLYLPCGDYGCPIDTRLVSERPVRHDVCINDRNSEIRDFYFHPITYRVDVPACASGLRNRTLVQQIAEKTGVEYEVEQGVYLPFISRRTIGDKTNDARIDRIRKDCTICYTGAASGNVYVNMSFYKFLEDRYKFWCVVCGRLIEKSLMNYFSREHRSGTVVIGNDFLTSVLSGRACSQECFGQIKNPTCEIMTEQVWIHRNKQRKQKRMREIRRVMAATKKALSQGKREAFPSLSVEWKRLASSPN